jgi:Integrase core domain
LKEWNISKELALDMSAWKMTIHVSEPWFRSCARDGSRYFVTFTDDFSRYGYVYLMRHKFESFEKFKKFKAEVENQFGKKIKVFRTDWGEEYLSGEFRGYLKAHGIVPQLTPSGTPQWNGVSERRNMTLLDMVRSMMSKAELSHSFWGFALETAAFMLNRVPSKSVKKTPYKLWFGKFSNVSFIKIWGCEAYVKRLMSDKLSPRSGKCIFMGYPKETKRYCFYYKSENKIVIARHTIFLEKEFLTRGSSESNVQLKEIRITHESDVGGDFTIHSMDAEASGSRTSKLSSHDDDKVVQDTPPQGVVEEASEPHAFRRSSRSSHPPERWLGLHQGSTCDAEDRLTYMEIMARQSSLELGWSPWRSSSDWKQMGFQAEVGCGR